MNKPLGLIAGIMPRSEQPITLPVCIFHVIIIPVLSAIQPPFTFYPLRSVRFFDLMQFTFIAEQHGRIIRYRRRYFNWLRLGQQLHRSWFICPPGSSGLFIKRSRHFERPLRPVMFGRQITADAVFPQFARHPVQEFRHCRRFYAGIAYP